MNSFVALDFNNNLRVGSKSHQVGSKNTEHSFLHNFRGPIKVTATAEQGKPDWKTCRMVPWFNHYTLAIPQLKAI